MGGGGGIGGVGGSVIEGRRGEYLLLEVELPGRGHHTAGVLLFDEANGRLQARLRRDWDQIADPDDVEVLEQIAHDLEIRAAEVGPEELLSLMEETLSNTLRVSERRATLMAGFEATLNRLYRQHVPSSVQQFRTHLPLYSCRAAAGRWGDQMPVEEEGWIEVPEGLRLTSDMFVAHVVGRSMEPVIPDGSLCVFRANVTGSRQGKRVLVENLSESEQGGQRYTVKRYTSDKGETKEGSWRHTRIRLEPLNPEYEAWEIEENSGCRVLAEFVCVVL